METRKYKLREIKNQQYAKDSKSFYIIKKITNNIATLRDLKSLKNCEKHLSDICICNKNDIPAIYF